METTSPGTPDSRRTVTVRVTIHDERSPVIVLGGAYDGVLGDMNALAVKIGKHLE